MARAVPTRPAGPARRPSPGGLAACAHDASIVRGVPNGENRPPTGTLVELDRHPIATGGSPCTPRPAAPTTRGARPHDRPDAPASGTPVAAGGRGPGRRRPAAGGSGGPRRRRRAHVQRASGASLTFEEPVADRDRPAAPPAEEATVDDRRVGLRPRGRRHSAAAVWTSDDGREWERTRREPGPQAASASRSRPPARAPTALSARGPRRRRRPRPTPPSGARRGDEWARVSPRSMGGDHEQWAFDVAAGDGGILVAGGENVWGEVRPAACGSAPTARRGRASTAAPAGRSTRPARSVRAVAAVGDGFVAVGSRTVDGEQDGVAWFSADGESWEPVDAPAWRAAAARRCSAWRCRRRGLVAGGYVRPTPGQGEPGRVALERRAHWGPPSRRCR